MKDIFIEIYKEKIQYIVDQYKTKQKNKWYIENVVGRYFVDYKRCELNSGERDALLKAADRLFLNRNEREKILETANKQIALSSKERSELLKAINKITPAGATTIAACCITTNKEDVSDTAYNTIAQYFDNYEKLIKQTHHDLQNENNEDAVEYHLMNCIQPLFSCFPYVDKNKFACCFRHFMVIYTEYKTYAESLTNTLFVEKTKDTERYKWNKFYCEIPLCLNDNNAKWILSLLGNLEIYNRKNPFSEKIRPKEASAKEWFYCLCKNGYYDTAGTFFKRFFQNSGTDKPFGLNINDFTLFLFQTPSARLIYLGYNLVKAKINREYSVQQWSQDVLKCNKNDNVVLWITLFDYYTCIYNACKKGNMGLVLTLAKKTRRFQLDITEEWYYVKPLIEILVIAINELLKKNQLAVLYKMLRLLGINNVLCYDNAMTINIWKNISEIGETNVYEITKTLFQHNNFAEVIFIYLNTHLRYCINLFDVLRKAGEKKLDIETLFADYQFDGFVSYIKENSTGRDKVFFFLRSVHAPSKKGRQFEKYDDCIVLKDKEYTKNANKYEFLEKGDGCKLRISGYSEAPQSRLFVEVSNKEQMLPESELEKRKQERYEFYKEVEGILRAIQPGNVSFPRKKKVYSISNCPTYNIRRPVAVEIVAAFARLCENEDELNIFFDYVVNNMPWININENRAAKRAATTPLCVEGKELEKIIECSNIIMNSTASNNIKKKIYANTIIRKYYPLENMADKIGDELYAEDYPLVLPLHFAQKDNKYYYFDTESIPVKDNDDTKSFFSKKQFALRKDMSDRDVFKHSDYYRFALAEYDKKQDVFLLKEQGKAEKFAQMARMIRDIRETPVEKLPKINEALQRLRYDVYDHKKCLLSAQQVSVLAGRMSAAFEGHNYEIESCRQILQAIEVVNPFKIYLGENKKYANALAPRPKEERELFQNGSEELINKATQNSWMSLCKIYRYSYLHLLYSPERFAKITAEEINNKSDEPNKNLEEKILAKINELIAGK